MLDNKDCGRRHPHLLHGPHMAQIRVIRNYAGMDAAKLAEVKIYFTSSSKPKMG